MSNADGLTYSVREAARDESATIAEIIRVAFGTVAEILGVDIPPLHESEADVAATFDAADAVFIAEANGRAIGTVRGETLEDATVMVRRLAVLPSFRNAGVARALMRALEAAYPDARRFELFTGAGEEGAVRLYESLGYSLMEPRELMGFPLVYMEKRR